MNNFLDYEEYEYDEKGVRFTAPAMSLINKRYLKKDENNNIIEKPYELYQRVAKFLSKFEKIVNPDATDKDLEKKEKICFKLLSNGEFIFNSPTLMNAGTELGQLSACFVLPLEDSISNKKKTGIFDIKTATALIHQSGGGTGFPFDNLRPLHDIVKKTGGISSGPVSFLKSFDADTKEIKQGGKRRGANMASFLVTHPDILSFLNMKKYVDTENYDTLYLIASMMYIKNEKILNAVRKNLVEKQLKNFNISVKITDKFMKNIENDDWHYVTNPRNKEKKILEAVNISLPYDIERMVTSAEIDAMLNNELITYKSDVVKYLKKKRKEIRKIKSSEIFDIIIKGAFNNGEPGILFIDRINRYNPLKHLGKIESTNPCGEQILLPFESCNLGSVNFGSLWKGNFEVFWKNLERVIKDSTYFLNSIIHLNKYPLKQIEQITKYTRKIGSGIMGWADLLLLLGIRYGNHESLILADEIGEAIVFWSKQESVEIAKNKNIGKFPAFKDSEYDRESKYFDALLSDITGRPKGSTQFERPHLDWNKLEEDFNKYGIANSTVTTIAPTGSISFLANCSGGIEPIFSWVILRKNILGGDTLESGLHPIVLMEMAKTPEFKDTWKNYKFLNKDNSKIISNFIENLPEYFVTTNKVTVNEHLKMQSAFQKWTSNAISKTINFPHDAKIEDVKEAFKEAFNLELAGLTVYRDGSRENQVMYNALDEKDSKINIEEYRKNNEPEIIPAIRIKNKCNLGNLYTVITYDNFGPYETFNFIGKTGSDVMAHCEAIGRLSSGQIQKLGMEGLNNVIKNLSGISSEPIWVAGGRTLSMPDAFAGSLKKFKSLVENFEVKINVGKKTGKLCSICGMGLIFTEGCHMCPNGCPVGCG